MVCLDPHRHTTNGSGTWSVLIIIQPTALVCLHLILTVPSYNEQVWYMVCAVLILTVIQRTGLVHGLSSLGPHRHTTDRSGLSRLHPHNHTVTMPSLTKLTSTVSEESLARDTHTRTHVRTHAHRHTHTYTLCYVLRVCPLSRGVVYVKIVEVALKTNEATKLKQRHDYSFH